MHKEPLKITLEFYNKKISSEIDHSDLKLDELHDLWVGILKNSGFHSDTVDAFYE